MKKSRFSEEQMVKILRQADKRPVAAVTKKHGVSEQTIYAWRKRFGTLESVDVKRLRQLEQENAKLKKINKTGSSRFGNSAERSVRSIRAETALQKLRCPLAPGRNMILSAKSKHPVAVGRLAAQCAAAHQLPNRPEFHDVHIRHSSLWMREEFRTQMQLWDSVGDLDERAPSSPGVFEG